MAEEGSAALTVLVADDDPGLSRVVRLILEQRGHRVHVASTAADARGVVAAHAIDVALVDARMPGDGVQLRRELEAGRLGGRTILMTGDPDARRADAGTGPLLGKPFDYDRLVDLVETLGRAGPADGLSPP